MAIAVSCLTASAINTLHFSTVAIVTERACLIHLALICKDLMGLLTMLLCNRGSTESAAFSEYLIAKADLAITVPDNLTFEEAATLGVGLSTVVSGVLVKLLFI